MRQLRTLHTKRTFLRPELFVWPANPVYLGGAGSAVTWLAINRRRAQIPVGRETDRNVGAEV